MAVCLQSFVCALVYSQTSVPTLNDLKKYFSPTNNYSAKTRSKCLLKSNLYKFKQNKLPSVNIGCGIDVEEPNFHGAEFLKICTTDYV